MLSLDESKCLRCVFLFSEQIPNNQRLTSVMLALHELMTVQKHSKHVLTWGRYRILEKGIPDMDCQRFPLLGVRGYPCPMMKNHTRCRGGGWGNQEKESEG